jgi:hypothetical protein
LAFKLTTNVRFSDNKINCQFHLADRISQAIRDLQDSLFASEAA